LPEGEEGRIVVEVERHEEEAVLRVSDNGMGMTPEAQANCFDMFFTTKEVGEGSGMGLAVVHNIVTNHGGRIEVRSEPGEGTTFEVFLPGEARPDLAAPAEEPEPHSTGPGTGEPAG
jgi:signal transduction histidine kinase